jgi:hypothetical protein
MARAKTERVETTVTSDRERTSQPSRPAHLTDQDIARHAYDLYMSRGCEAGHDMDDWLQAEREVNVDKEC